METGGMELEARQVEVQRRERSAEVLRNLHRWSKVNPDKNGAQPRRKAPKKLNLNLQLLNRRNRRMTFLEISPVILILQG